MRKVVIIGYGKMAQAILFGMKSGNWDMQSVEVVGRDEEKLKVIKEEFNVKTALIDGYDISQKIVILAIKPYALQEVSMRIRGEADVLISILAGKSLVELQRIKAKSYIRAMPNVAAKYAASTTVITGDENARGIATEILSKIGEVIWVESDDEVDMATAIIGSGPAFLAMIAEAIADGGVYVGLKRDVAVRLTRGLFKSFGALEDEFCEIKKSVMSPKGTTAEGIRSLEEDSVRSAFMKGVIKTYEKAKRI